MAQTLQFRRGTTSELSSITGSVGELFVNTEKDTVVVMDGSTSGGFELTQNNATQTLTNKTLTSPIISTIINTGTLTLPTSTGTIALTSDIPTNNNQLTNGAAYITASSTDTLTNKTINGSQLVDGSVSNTKLANSFITVTDGTTSTATSLGGTITFSGTANEVEVGESSGTITIGLPNDVTIGNNLVVTGNLTVSGSTTTVNTETINLADNIIVLNSNATGSATEDAGIEIERGDDTNKTLLWNETSNKWTVGSETFVAGTFEGDLTGNVTGDVTGNADTATALETARTIGGVSFNGTANIDLPGVNTTGNQDTSGNAATATALATARTIAGQSFDGTVNITIASTDLSNTSNITLNDATQTLTNKTLTSPVIATISNTGTLTLPTSTGTVALTSDIPTNNNQLTNGASYITASSTDTLTNKSGNISQWTNDAGYLTSFTETNDLTAAVTWANVPDANITQSSVTQHQAALSITESQISDLGAYITASSTDTLTNKTINSASNTITITESNISDLGSYITASSTDTLTNKSISLTNNTLTGTTAQFNTALSDGSFATLAGIETLTNKTISGSSNTLSNIGNASLTNSSITIGSDAISLGGTRTDINGLTSLDVDNITINGNTISSTDTNGNIVLDPNGTGVVDVNTSRITGVSDPVNANDAANKQYVDAVAEGLHVHEQVHAMITTPLATITGDTVTYNNGTSGVGATLTLSTALDLAGGDLDGDTDITTGDRVIINGESTAAHNGIYVVTSTTVLTRAADFDTPTEMAGGDFVWVTHGTTYADTGWVLGEAVTTVGTTAVSFVQFSGLGQITAGDALTKTGNTLDVAVDNSTIEVSSDALRVKDAGITSDKLATNAVTTLKITDGNVTAAKLASTLDLSGNTITLPSSFVTTTDTQTLTNKTINLSSNTLTGTTAQFNTALSDGSFATLAGTETLTNKTLTSPIISSISNTGTLTLPTSTGTIALTSDIPTNNNQLTNGSSYITASSTDTLTNKTINSASNTIIITESNISDLGSYITASSTDTLTNKSGNISQWTNDSGYLTSFTETNDLTSSVTWANVPDANITQSSVTQHQAALSITESQISDLGSYITASSTDTLTNKTLSSAVLTGTLTAGGGVGSSGQVLKSTGTGVEWTSLTDNDTNTTYTVSAVDSGDNAIIRLTGSDSSTDDITLVAGSNITITPSGDNITIASTASGGAADLSAVAEDILPGFDEVYDIGSSTYKWYDGFFTNSINLDTIALTNSSGTLAINSDISVTGDATLGSALIDDLLISENTITSDTSTALEYLGDKGVVEINNSNLDVREGDWIGVPVVETVSSVPPLTTGSEGIIRYNKDEGRFEGYNADGWASLGGLETNADGDSIITGNLVVSGDITSTSDETLKENIKSIEGALDIVTKLSGKFFTMKSDETQKEKVGFIAQEIEQHLPQVVSTDPNGIKSVSYGNVAALLVEAIKELNQKIEDLKK